MDSDQSKMKLSKGILDMKFMKKTKERVEKEEERAEGQSMYSNEITEEMRRGGKHIVVEVGINSCKDILDGRMSFGGMNPEIERLMAEESVKKLEKIEKDKETDISDVEMAKRYNVLSENVHKKGRNKKTKFLKPAEMD